MYEQHNFEQKFVQQHASKKCTIDFIYFIIPVKYRQSGIDKKIFFLFFLLFLHILLIFLGDSCDKNTQFRNLLHTTFYAISL